MTQKFRNLIPKLIQYNNEGDIMNFDFDIIWSIVAGLVVCIPLVIKLVNVTIEVIRNKWNILNFPIITEK